jgi:hypothetical protein
MRKGLVLKYQNPGQYSHCRPAQTTCSKTALGQTSTSEAFAYTSQPSKEEAGKTNWPPRKYFCENELRRPLPEVPNGKTEEQEKAERESAVRKTTESISANGARRHHDPGGGMGSVSSPDTHIAPGVDGLGGVLLGAQPPQWLARSAHWLSKRLTCLLLMSVFSTREARISSAGKIRSK